MTKYSEKYNLFKHMIVDGKLKPNEKMPSIRQAANLYQISRTTVQNAYFQLAAEGYIFAKPQSGYYVSSMKIKDASYDSKESSQKNIIYDLTGNNADPSNFDFSLWQRYIKSALRQSSRMMSYSDVQGESDLRSAICQYIKQRRNVITSPDNIVVGAGVQALLQIICPLIKNANTISFPDSSFAQGICVFENYGFNVKTRYKDADVIYVAPSHMNDSGDIMPIKRRLELCEYSYKNNSIVIEDDYENDFIYSSTPTPSLFALGKGNIIYMGSFSALLLPGIRISFMVLNDKLSESYSRVKDLFAQTASKTEQIALCSYLRDGNMTFRTKKIRRVYTAKAKKMCLMLNQILKTKKAHIGENGLTIIIDNAVLFDAKEFENHGILLKYEKNKIIMSPSGIDDEHMEDVCGLIGEIINNRATK